MGEPPSGTITVLFTDMAGSTRLWEERLDDMPAVLARHDAVVGHAVESHRGHVVKGTGDGMLAVFSRAQDAIDAAGDAQVALRAEGLPGVRMAVHTGDVVERDGDYFGPTLNRAARLVSIGHGGQVLVSGATQRLVLSGELLDLGAHRLRDLSEPELVFQLVRPGLPVDFLPLRSLDALPTNLPVQLTSFVGRASEVEQIHELLGEHRLVTVTGVGGVGKTRLALHAAADVLPRFRDGVWLCELSPVPDDDGVAHIVAVTFGVDTRGELMESTAVCRFLRGKELLLVLDNCEHVLTGVGDLVVEILGSSSGVRVLATGREGLGIAGEQVLPLRSLDVVRVGADVDTARASPGVQLFVDRAKLVRPMFELTAGNAGAVVEICRRLDGIPLAIELAAARAVSLSPSEIAAHLDERFRLLTGSGRRSVERHQTLRAAVEWSYSLLSDIERGVFTCLAAFSGGFTADAAAVVGTGAGFEQWDVLDALDRLVRKSMLVADEDTTGRTRYVLLETLRQYAEERLQIRGDADDTRRRHAAFMADLAEDLGRRLQGPEERDARRELATELDNLRSAALWALERGGDEQLGVRIAAALAAESARNPASGIAVWASLAMPGAERVGGEARSLVAGACAYAALARSDHDEVQRISSDTLRAGAGYSTPLATATAAALLLNGDGRRAVATLEEAEASVRDECPYDRAWLAFCKAFMLSHSDGRAAGIAAAEAAMAFARRSGNPSSLGCAHDALGLALLGTDDPRALDLLKIAVNEYGDLIGILFGSTLVHLAEAEARSGESHCLVSLRDALEWILSIEYRPQLTVLINSAAIVFVLLNRMTEAAVAGGVGDGEMRIYEHFGATERELRNQFLDHAAATLGEDNYQAARQRGLAMSSDDAVRFLRDILPPPERPWGHLSSRQGR